MRVSSDLNNPLAEGRALRDDIMPMRQASGLKFIACPAVLGELADGAVEGVDCRKLEAQLHVSPERLKEALRVAVAEADVPGATIVLGYGLCSNSVLGLKTEHATLVVPRVDDCIAMLLGSNEAFSTEAEKERGSYYVAKAYLEECDTIMSEHEKLVEKRGRERAEQMMRLLLKHYTRIVLVDTGRYDMEPHRARVAGFAETFDLAVEEVPGTTRILDALVAGEWGDDFVVAPPGHELTLRDFRPELFSGDASAPPTAPPERRAGVNLLCIAGFLGSGKTTVLLEIARAMTERGLAPRRHRERDRRGRGGRRLRARAGPAGAGALRRLHLLHPAVRLWRRRCRQSQSRYDPDWVIVEPTGLAAPGDLLGVIVDHCPEVDTIRVLTLVDAARWPMLLEIVEPLVTAQLEAADIVAVNKSRRGRRGGAGGGHGERSRARAARRRSCASPPPPAPA